MLNARATWYFDFISPFAYLQWQKLQQLPLAEIEYRPILFAGLLNQLGHKGPAEIPSKRVFSYRQVLWRAARDGVALTFPPAHPFNPLPPLRLCVAAGATRAAIDTVFRYIWRDGRAADTPEGISELAQQLGIANATEAMGSEATRTALARNFEQALEDGVFGVPSLVCDGELFWGDDATPMFADYLDNRDLFKTDAMQHVAALPIGVRRAQAQTQTAS